MILNLFIPGVPQNSNASGQWARMKAATNRKHFRQLAAEIAGAEATRTGWSPPDFTMILARQISPVRRRRDPTGLAERLKGILDGLVDAGLIPDDDEDHIAITLNHSRKGPKAGIELTLVEKPNHDLT